MLILLPPSEAKTPSRRGGALELGSLSSPSLTEHRTRVLDALVSLCEGPGPVAQRTLKLSDGLRDEIARNAALRDSPATRVSALYTGVLYDNLGLDTLSAAAKRRANRQVLVASALFGALRLTDRVPAYRLSGGVTLPGIGAVTTSWRPALDGAIPEVAGRGLILDLRSSSYSTMWSPDATLAARTATVRVLHERVPGDPASRTVVSHFNKATKGRIVRELLEAGADPRSPDALAEALAGVGRIVEMQPARSGRPRGIDVVVPEV